MPMSERIKIMLIKRKMTKNKKTEMIGTSPQNLSGKLSRDNFCEADLRKIAVALNCTLESVFIMNDTGEKV